MLTQKQGTTGEKGAAATSSENSKEQSAKSNKICLKNLPVGSTMEELIKSLAELNLNVDEKDVHFSPSDKEPYAEISFAELKSLCNAAVIIDKSSFKGKPFERENTQSTRE